MENRDNGLNRYFLHGRQKTSSFNLENIDILDYRIAAHAGDTVVQLALQLHKTSMPPAYLKKIHGVAEEFAYMGRNVIDAFVGSDRKAAIVAISQHKQFEKRMQNLRTSLESEKNISVTYLDLLYLFERIEKAWNDIADLIKPVYVA